MKLLLYCTKSKPYLCKDRGIEYDLSNKKLVDNAFTRFNPVNGKIVAECDFEVEEIKYQDIENYNYDEILPLDKILEKSCLTKIDLEDYLNGNNGYAIHIKNLHIFDEPKELKDLEPKREIHQCIHRNLIIDEELEIPIKAPQNMMRVKLRKSYYDGIPVSNDDINANEETLEDYILISIHPEWLCKILNGEKTIEIRKKILNNMIKEK